MEKIQDILFFDLRPWKNTLPDSYFKYINHTTNNVVPIFHQQYRVEYLRHISERTIYCQIIIDNDLTVFCNMIFQETKNVSNCLLAYKIDKSRKILRELIISTGEIINLQQLNISNLESNTIDFQHKEATHITNYLLSALIKCDLEIQLHFYSSIDDIDKLEIPDYFARLLKQKAPENSFILDVTSQVASTAITENFINDNYTIFLRKAQHYQFIELPKYKALSQKNQIQIVNHIMSETVPYAVAMLDFLEYPKHLTNKYNLPKEKQYSHIAYCLNTSTRLIKGNFLVLNPASKEDRLRYTAPDFLNAVKTFYFSLTDKTK